MSLSLIFAVAAAAVAIPNLLFAVVALAVMYYDNPRRNQWFASTYKKLKAIARCRRSTTSS